MSVAEEIERVLLDAEDEAHQALQVGGYVPLDDDIGAGVTYGELRRWLQMLIDEGTGASPPAEQGRKPGSDHLVDGGIDAAPRSTGT